MDLVCKGVEMNAAELSENGIRVQVIGERSRFSTSVREAIERIESITAKGENRTLVLAINYSSRSELTYAVQHIAARVKAGEMEADAITEQTISQALYTAAMPDPDLIIRTSGEYRLSNFLMWQASYSEFYFPEVLWPDFTEEEFDKALEEFAHRERRYGLV
jgi:undecaprenyl diphosphate synthase